MKKHLTVTLLVGALFVLSIGHTGCTSLLGDFSPGAACTQCGSECVDLTTTANHCGACGTVCGNGQTCQASQCKCPAEASLTCDGRCTKEDRTHCGPSCGPCQNDEVCSNSRCEPAAGISFESVPISPTGWTTTTGSLTFRIKPTGQTGTVYECRTGPAAAFTPTVPAWKPCDGASGTTTNYTPEPDQTTPEGTYRTEVRYRSDTFRSETIAHSYYVHHALDNVETCPRAGNATDGPKFSDDDYFKVAQLYAAANPTVFAADKQFPALGNPRAPSDAIDLFNPFIKIPFTAITTSTGMRYSNLPWPANGGDYIFKELTLRHKYVMNAARTLILVKRQYVHPKTKDCVNQVNIGHNIALQFGPDPGPFRRGERRLACEAFVVNTHGKMICLVRNQAGTEPELAPIDYFNVGFTNQNGTINATAAGATTITSTGTNFSGTAGWYVQIPAAFGYWYKIGPAPTATSFTITPALKSAVAAGTGYKYTNVLTNRFVVDTGYAKLHADSHGFSTGVKPNAVRRTKCDTPGCNTNKPWLTYLPP